MVKKLASIGVGAALFLAAAVPAFAANNLSVINVDTAVLNGVTTQANTGYNYISWPWVGSGIWTGNASAVSQVTNQVNTTQVKSCGCFQNIQVVNEGTLVGNTILTQANTGYNAGGGDPDGPPFVGGIHTGDASAGGAVTNVVNTTVVGL